jgi:hypothetical protein
MNLDKLFKHLADEHGLLLLESEKREIADCLNEKDFLLDYEIRGSWWPQYIRFRWMQFLAGKYFGYKVRRKYSHMRRSLQMKDAVRKWKEAGL